MKWLKEITTDKVNYEQCPHQVPLHSYLTNDSKEFLHAFRNTNTKEITYFDKPLKFDTSRRKFVEIQNPSWSNNHG